MKIAEINNHHILFDNGNKITFTHYQDCCEHNYADFEQLDDLARNAKFDSRLDFEAINNCGFRFGNKPNNMHFVPCYSEQNGYYTREIDIYYNGNQVLGFNAKFVSDW
jgi:hypothetical protein